MRPFGRDLAKGFDAPTDLPQDADEAAAWQRANRAWWERHPMRYDWNAGIDAPEFSREFFQQIDRRFFGSVSEYLPWTRQPFDQLIPFAELAGKDVLEIGVGNGSAAQLLAQAARSFTGVDLTEYAIRSTSARMRVFGLGNARVVRADAEQLPFPDASFDFVWSWGVVHHSSNTNRVLQQIARVLRPGGRAVLMVYYRGLYCYYVMNGLFRGVLQGQWRHARSAHAIAQGSTDGAIARFYSAREWRELCGRYFDVTGIRVMGDRANLLPLPAGLFKDRVSRLIPNGITRLLSNDLRMGPYLVSSLVKAR